jgi:glycosyltransferase involved in cell wall biosynthesis
MPVGTDGRPLVSILTPSLNHGHFLDDCIRSVDRQSYRPLEHIVYDGGSKDETHEILRRAPETVRWVSEPDRGQSDALNKALSLSNGEILGWLNSDDAYFDPEAVEAAVELFAERPEIDIVYGHAALVNSAGLVLHMMWAPPFAYRLLRVVNFVVQPTVFLRRRIVAETMVDESLEYAMDRELWLRLGRESRFARLDRIVAIDRHHPLRKVYSGDPRAVDEDRRLDDEYVHLPRFTIHGARRTYAAFARFAGARLLLKASRPVACDAHVDSLGRLGVRQVAVRRRRMPVGAAA